LAIVYDHIFGGFSAKNTIYTPYIYGPALGTCLSAKRELPADKDPVQGTQRSRVYFILSLVMASKNG
jgi:hypothetical protein